MAIPTNGLPSAPASLATPTIRKRGGRPPSEKKRDKQLTIYLTSLEQSVVKKRAEKAGLNQSDYCRQQVLAGQAVVRLSVEENALLNEAARLGNNLNQLTHRAHADGIRSVAIEAQRLLRQLSQILDKPTQP